MQLTKENLLKMLEPDFVPECPYVHGICGQFDNWVGSPYSLSNFNKKVLELLPWYTGTSLSPVPRFHTKSKWEGQQLAMRKGLIRLWYDWVYTIECLGAGMEAPINQVTKAFPKRWWQSKAAYLRSLKA